MPLIFKLKRAKSAKKQKHADLIMACGQCSVFTYAFVRVFLGHEITHYF